MTRCAVVRLYTRSAYFWNATKRRSCRCQLNLHPNSLRGRLVRISDLLGRDLADATTRLDLFLALESCALLPDTISYDLHAGGS